MNPTFFIMIIALSLSCEVNEKDRSSLIPELKVELIKEIKIIGHKGSGDLPKYGYLQYQSNSYQSIKNAFELIDGSEIDLQISKDLTLWLYHDFTIKDCHNFEVNIANLSDDEISLISGCNYGNQIIDLPNFISRLSHEKYKYKTLSLDMKLLDNPQAIKLFKNRFKYLSKVNEKIKKISAIKFISLQIEVSNIGDFNFFKENNSNNPYLLIRKQESLIRDSSALNFSYDLNLLVSDSTNQIVGKKNQIWVANTVDELINAINYNPNYIQTDNIFLAHFFKNITQDNLIEDPLFFKANCDTKNGDEYVGIYTLKLEDFKNNFLLKLSFQTKNQLNEGLMAVFSSRNNKGEAVYWSGNKLNSEKENYYSFVDLAKLRQLDCKELKVYIWNTNKIDFQLYNYSINQLVIK